MTTIDSEPVENVPVDTTIIDSRNDPSKGQVAIKKEFLLPAEDIPERRASSSETTGMNKKRSRRNNQEELKLCVNTAQEIPCVKEGCKYSHDLKAYLAVKEQDLEGVCPFVQIGSSCSFGHRCRFYASHLDENGKIKFPLTSEARDEKRGIWSNDLQHAIRKNEVAFPKSDRFVSMMKEQAGKTDDECDAFIKLRPVERKKLDLKGKLYLAPLTTVGNLPFRRICKEFGADVTCGEMAMVSQIKIAHLSEWALLKRHSSEDLFGIQLCGSNYGEFVRAAELMQKEEISCDFIDINLGCPIDLVYKKGMGSALMDRNKRLKEISYGLHYIYQDESTALTLKVRTGIDRDKPIAHKLLPVVNSWNIFSAATIHGRSRAQRYTKEADWDYIAQVNKACPDLPLIGNGDIFNWEDVERVYNNPETANLSTVMIGRGALIKPWIFTEIKERRNWDISSNERFDLLNKFARYGLEHFGSDSLGVAKTRRFLLEWCSFLYRYVPHGLLEFAHPQKINQRPPAFFGRDEMETLMASGNVEDWKKLVGRTILGPTPDGFEFEPKHKANSYA